MRRAIAFLVFLAALYYGKAFHEAGGLAGLIGLLIAVPAGFFSLVVVIFNLQVLGPRKDYEESGWGVLSERQGTVFGAFLVFLFGLMFLYAGFREGLGLRAVGWCTLGALFIWLARKLAWPGSKRQ